MKRRERVVLELDPGRFIEEMRRAARATDKLRTAIDKQHPTALDAATWEPHDWSEWA